MPKMTIFRVQHPLILHPLFTYMNENKEVSSAHLSNVNLNDVLSDSWDVSDFKMDCKYRDLLENGSW